MEPESLPPLGIHIEEEVDIAEILGDSPPGSQDDGKYPDEGEPDEPEDLV